MLGVPVEMGPKLLDWSHRMVAMYMHGRSRAAEDSANEAARDFSVFLRGYVGERRRKPGDDLLSLLIAAQEDGQKLSEDELISSTILLLNAGHEATVHQTGNAVRTILGRRRSGRLFRLAGGDRRHRGGMPALRRAAAHVHALCLRDRRSRRRRGHPSRRDRSACCSAWRTVILAPSPSPTVFDPDRSDQKNVSFGAGIHFCIGAPLARLELAGRR